MAEKNQFSSKCAGQLRLDNGDYFMPIARFGRKCILLFLAVVALYWRTRSKGLDDWDSVQFALGVKRFDLFAHQPHPPGYPLYIFFGWLGAHMARMEIPSALILASCLGAGLFVA